ncbi:30S ribosomal protein S21 [Candidatus Marinamargulisbacteria bacterium SCGC AG-410-N11]|nr:30S ribosomal protein S21 [Candidatus Marinamargulisbacteria bacterium SCGC AG-410-N11]
MVKQEKRQGESFDNFYKKFKRKLKNEGTLQELRKREFFTKPSDIKKEKEKQARNRTRMQQKADELT